MAERAFTDVEAASPAPYWSETIAYQFSEAQIDHLEDTADVLHKMCLQAVDHVIDNDLFFKFGIQDENWKDYIATSWQQQHPDVYGRFDFSYDGKSPAKLLEYNADTPTSLYETSVLQWDWLRDRGLKDQFNFVHERLITTWKKVAARRNSIDPIHFTTIADNPEDQLTTRYMQDTCAQAGVATEFILIEDIGWNGSNFVDLKGRVIEAMFKLYPWEWIAREEFGKHVLSNQTGLIEPAWKMLLSNKALLPILWDGFPGHENLLPAYETVEPLAGVPYVKKAKLGREGASVEILGSKFDQVSEGPYGSEGYVYQRLKSLPVFGSNHAVCGVWVVGGKACGLGMREDDGPITKNTSRFVPHFFGS